MQITLTKNVLVFKRDPKTGYLEASHFEVRAGAQIEAICRIENVLMPNGAICEKSVASFEEPWSRQVVYLLIEELCLAEAVPVTLVGEGQT